ncbi:hypothetical protein D7Z54_01350 [Salibacterium salarium]|uniref:Uncharacterized protein n=1 Tax=Salibacterium salarium TaxID=284579 RepID=A0A3R9PC68_9BACI|nr:hypothetical protein [Salibacterium salarium]RSL35243.1 hypothetical protein D7Z54_01350 [Salibacterium salarium]
MDEAKWSMQEVKLLKKVQLFQNNFVMLLVFVLFAFFAKNGGSVFFLFGLCCVFFWISTANMLYTLKTGRTIGTKISKRVQAFDRDNMGVETLETKDSDIGSHRYCCKCCFYSVLVCSGF